MIFDHRARCCYLPHCLPTFSSPPTNRGGIYTPSPPPLPPRCLPRVQVRDGASFLSLMDTGNIPTSLVCKNESEVDLYPSPKLPPPHYLPPVPQILGFTGYSPPYWQVTRTLDHGYGYGHGSLEFHPRVTRAHHYSAWLVICRRGHKDFKLLAVKLADSRSLHSVLR